MWTLLKSLLVRWGILRLLVRLLGPFAAVIMTVLLLLQLGWPVLLVLFGAAALSVFGLVMLLRWLATRPFRPGTDPH